MLNTNTQTLTAAPVQVPTAPILFASFLIGGSDLARLDFWNPDFLPDFPKSYQGPRSAGNMTLTFDKSALNMPTNQLCVRAPPLAKWGTTLDIVIVNNWIPQWVTTREVLQRIYDVMRSPIPESQSIGAEQLAQIHKAQEKRHQAAPIGWKNHLQEKEGGPLIIDYFGGKHMFDGLIIDECGTLRFGLK